MSNGCYPATRLQRFKHRPRDSNTSYFLNVTACYRLAICNNGKRFQHRTRVSRRFLGIKPVKKFLHLRPGMEAPATGNIHQFHPFPSQSCAQLFKQPAQNFRTQFLIE